MKAFSYAAPTTVDEALSLAADYRDRAKLLAGGQSLMVLLRQGLVLPDIVIGLKDVTDLAGISAQTDHLEIGAMTTYREVANSDVVQSDVPILSTAARSVGSDHIRNLGTIGGSLCHADPSGDVPVAMLALGASVSIAGAASRRECHIDDWFTGLFEVSIEPDELVTAIRVPTKGGNTTFGYRRFSYREGEYPMIVAAAVLSWEGETCSGARVSIGGAGPYPRRVPEVEAAVEGTGVGTADIERAAHALGSVVNPFEDIRGSAEWKREVAMEYTKRVLGDTVTMRSGGK